MNCRTNMCGLRTSYLRFVVVVDGGDVHKVQLCSIQIGHDNDLNACGGTILEMLYNHEVQH